MPPGSVFFMRFSLISITIMGEYTWRIIICWLDVGIVYLFGWVSSEQYTPGPSSLPPFPPSPLSPPLPPFPLETALMAGNDAHISLFPCSPSLHVISHRDFVSIIPEHNIFQRWKIFGPCFSGRDMRGRPVASHSLITHPTHCFWRIFFSNLLSAAQNPLWWWYLIKGTEWGRWVSAAVGGNGTYFILL